LTDLPLDEYVDHFCSRGKIGSFLAVSPAQSYHVVSVHGDLATSIQPLRNARVLINGGYFAFRREIFSYLRDGEELVEQPFQRLVREEQLLAYQHDGYWASMDTFKDRQQLEDLYARGNAPWEVWKGADASGQAPVSKLNGAAREAIGHV
jgi:glucose-1-phosphate cytidylyltransferase